MTLIDFCNDAESAIPPKSVQAIVADPGVPPWNKLRVVMLYALRYQKSQTGNIAALINLMLANGVPREDAKVCAKFEMRNLF